jgi:hypothetical protein
MDTPQPNAKKAESYGAKIIDLLNSEDRSYIKVFERCQKVIDTVGLPSDDALKRGRFTQEIMNEAAKRVVRKER